MVVQEEGAISYERGTYKRGGQPARLEAIGPTLVNTWPTPTLNPSSLVMAAPLVVPEATVR
jgi:hypothetical protein